jgi:DNA-binding transcriptional LysR family regulator
VSAGAISLHIAQLRKELGDQLFVRTPVGLAFTPGGPRLASRAAELLGLQERTIQEVGQWPGGSGHPPMYDISTFLPPAAAGSLASAPRSSE